MNGFVNLPLSDALALRVTVYNDSQGGWIDNIPATSRSPRSASPC